MKNNVCVFVCVGDNLPEQGWPIETAGRLQDTFARLFGVRRLGIIAGHVQFVLTHLPCRSDNEKQIELWMGPRRIGEFVVLLLVFVWAGQGQEHFTLIYRACRTNAMHATK